MDELLFDYFTTDNISGKKCTERWLKSNNNSLYNQILKWCDMIDVIGSIEFKRKVYHYIYKLTNIPKCKTCKGPVKYIRIRDGYQSYCSDSCVKKSDEYREKWLNTWKDNNSDGKSIEKRKQTLEKKYGSEYDKIIQKNREKAMLEKHGVKNSFQMLKIKEKRKDTLKEKYGSETFNNPDKTRMTRISNGSQINDEDVEDFLKYKKVVINRTITVYRNNKDLINPQNLNRSKKEYHIDHLFSIKQGFLQNIPVDIISHPCNLHMIDYKENIKKQDECWITKSDLLNSIILYDKEIKFKNKYLQDLYFKTTDVALYILSKESIQENASSGPTG